jgi:hypothetical protein
LAWFSIWQKFFSAGNVALCPKEKSKFEIIDAISAFRTSSLTRQQAVIIHIRAAEDADRNSGTWLGAS